MTEAIQIRLGGYGPPSTSFSKALRIVGDRLGDQFGGRIDVEYVWNVMDLGYAAEDVAALTERGELTLSYQTTSGLSGAIPELGLADLPFLFKDEAAARGAIDGAFGAFLADHIEAKMNCRVLGFFENGFRHISNALRPVRKPADLAGMKIRILDSKIHARSFELLGARPAHIGLAKLIAALKNGELDGQENPLANTVTYGAHKLQHFHTLTNHFYVSRAVLAHRPSFDAMPADLQDAMRSAVREATVLQRQFAEAEEISARRAIEDAGCEVIDLSDAERQAFAAAVQPVYRETQEAFGGRTAAEIIGSK
jgi:tripartite ATP-independent transporter DctP family solute receptor